MLPAEIANRKSPVGNSVPFPGTSAQTGERHGLSSAVRLPWAVSRKPSALSPARLIGPAQTLYFAISGRCDELLSHGPPP